MRLPAKHGHSVSELPNSDWPSQVRRCLKRIHLATKGKPHITIAKQDSVTGPRESSGVESGYIWAALNIEVLSADEGEANAGMQGRGETRDSGEKPPIRSIGRRHSHMRRSASDSGGNRTRFAWVRGELSDHFNTAVPFAKPISERARSHQRNHNVRGSRGPCNRVSSSKTSSGEAVVDVLTNITEVVGYMKGSMLTQTPKKAARLDSTVLCTLEPQMFVYWLLPQRVASDTSQLTICPSPLSFLASLLLAKSRPGPRQLTPQKACNGSLPCCSLVNGRNAFSFPKLHGGYWLLLRAPRKYSSEKAPGYLATLHYKPLVHAFIVEHATHCSPVATAEVSERLACSPPTKANRVQSPAGSLPDFRMWVSCRTMCPVGGFSRGFPVYPFTFIPALLHSHLNHPHRLLRPRC
ncbi:hypothetical protein PR048_012389 [Dryococelus australis]|uniref:Uncharacterized protein n=1 Tax=Dryococelus australis TaxID=614101 RepID=A0ABQ9HPS7_9NEOP|nr:hypothetical protein PR048_012389 [Dryococelus australis]